MRSFFIKSFIFLCAPFVFYGVYYHYNKDQVHQMFDLVKELQNTSSVESKNSNQKEEAAPQGAIAQVMAKVKKSLKERKQFMNELSEKPAEKKTEDELSKEQEKNTPKTAPPEPTVEIEARYHPDSEVYIGIAVKNQKGGVLIQSINPNNFFYGVGLREKASIVSINGQRKINVDAFRRMNETKGPHKIKWLYQRKLRTAILSF